MLPSSHKCETLSPCQHEDIDPRIIIYAFHVVNKEEKNNIIRTIDVVLAVEYFKCRATDKLEIAFGNGKNYNYIPVHYIIVALGIAKSESPLGFHAFTGCDSVVILGKG